MPIIMPPALVESLPFPSMSDQLNGTYNSKAYAWAERHPYVAAAMSGQADATYQNAMYVKDRADTLDLAASAILDNIQLAQDAADTASNAASDATDSADSASASAAAAAASAGSVNTAYLLNRANHTGTQSVATITGAGVSTGLLDTTNMWSKPQKTDLAPKSGSLLSIQGEPDSYITQIGVGYTKRTDGYNSAYMDFYASREIRNAAGQYADYLRIGTADGIHIIGAGAGNVTGGANGSHPIDVQVNGTSIMTFFGGQVNANKPMLHNNGKLVRGESYSAYVDTSPTTWNRLIVKTATNQPWAIEGIMSMPGVHWAAKISFSGTTSAVWSPRFKFELLGSYAYHTMIPYQFRVVTSAVNNFVALDFRFVGGSGQNQWIHFESLFSYGAVSGERAIVSLGARAGAPTLASEAAHIIQIGTESSLTLREVDYMASQGYASVIEGTGVRTSVAVSRTWPTA